MSRFCKSLVLVASCLFLLGGCIKDILPSSDDSRPRDVRPVSRSPIDEAKAAMSAGDYARAEYIAQRESGRSGITSQELRDISRIYALSALRNNHPNVALTALDNWQAADPSADKSAEWQDIWCEATGALSSWGATSRAEALYQDESRSAQARSMAGIFLAVRHWENGKTGDTMSVLEQLYSSATDRNLMAMMERRLALQLHNANSTAQSLAAAAVTAENQTKYPYNIILIDQLRRRTMNEEQRAEAQEALNRLSKEITLADPSLFKKAPTSTLAAPTAIGPISGKPVVLALPLSGPLGNISAKIVSGAEAACREFSASGVQVSLVLIDTDQPGWLAQLESLPSEATVVGGFLQNSAFNSARDQGVTSRRALFTFMSSLSGGEEGQKAWRFFPSPDDQMNTLLRLSSSLGIKGYAIFYPDEGYGERMSSLFEHKASSMGFSVHKASYPPDNPAEWLRSVADLLATNKNPEHAKGATFQAIFLPDTWKSMDIIVPNIFYYNETRQLLMGTFLWEQGISGGAFVSPQYYDLAVFPGAWDPTRLTPAGERLQSQMFSSGKGTADFWSGLGYDFARFAAGLNLRPGWTPSSVNSMLLGVQIDWSMAPIQWDGAGRASQRLYLFSPVEGGFTLIDEQEFAKKFSSAWK